MKLIEIIGGLSIFYVIITIIYWKVGGEPVGVGGCSWPRVLRLWLGSILVYTKRISVILPEDNVTAQISGGAGELIFSPLWWPLPVAYMCTMGLGLIIGWWLTLVVSALMISVIGLVTEYEKPVSPRVTQAS